MTNWLFDAERLARTLYYLVSGGFISENEARDYFDQDYPFCDTIYNEIMRIE